MLCFCCCCSSCFFFGLFSNLNFPQFARHATYTYMPCTTILLALPSLPLLTPFRTLFRRVFVIFCCFCCKHLAPSVRLKSKLKVECFPNARRSLATAHFAPPTLLASLALASTPLLAFCYCCFFFFFV